MVIPPFTEAENKSRSLNNSAAEFMVLKKLENIGKERGWIVRRSLRLENHPSKIEGEIDVVIFTQTQGIILLEIKGSILKINDGEWSTFNRGKQSWEIIESPFEQMKSGYFAFKSETKTLFRLFSINPLISWACIFPECENIKGTVSYPSWRFCDATQFNELEIFLNQLVRKEKSKLSNLERKNSHTNLEPKISYNLLERLTPTKVDGNLVAAEFNETLMDLERETKLVHELMKAFSSNRFMFAEGAAGTGKTRAAIYECQRLTKMNKTFLFLCKSPFLADNIRMWLEDELNTTSSLVLCGTSISQDINLNFYDALLIDEAQDLVHLQEIRRIILYFEKQQKLIRLFGDFEFQNLFQSREMIFTWFKENDIQPTFNRLSINCRNTMQIGTKIKRIAEFDDSILSLSSIQGENLEIYPNIEEKNLVKTIEGCISSWTQKFYPAAAITVLLSQDFSPEEKNNIEFLNSINACHHQKKDQENNVGKVNYSTVMDFKGLESPCVIIVMNHFDENWPTILYTAISRARLKVYLIFTEKIGIDNLQKILCKI